MVNIEEYQFTENDYLIDLTKSFITTTLLLQTNMYYLNKHLIISNVLIKQLYL